MALQKEIWIAALIANLFADNSFANRSQNHSGFVNNKRVHVPNAGAAPSVKKNRSTLPATITTRTDVDLAYDINEFTTDPLRVDHAETIELSYNKRESIISASRNALTDAVHDDLILSWVPSGYTKVLTSGEATPAHQASATGNRKKFTINDVLKVKIVMDRDNIPSTGRCILLDCDMYNELLASLTQNEYHAFLASSDAQKGIVGRLYGFDFYMRTNVLRVVASGASIATENAASDSAAGIAWQEDCVARALGNTELFVEEKNPSYYGDIFSALVRAGGHYVRNDKKGVVVIAQGTAA